MSIKEAHETLFKRMAQADGVIRPVESETIAAILNSLNDDPADDAHSARRTLSSQTVGAISELAGRPMRERERVIQLLWVVAMCDGELHSREEEMVLRVADALSVPRATVAKQQPDF